LARKIIANKKSFAIASDERGVMQAEGSREAGGKRFAWNIRACTLHRDDSIDTQ
jgi:hypothetical protein